MRFHALLFLAICLAITGVGVASEAELHLMDGQKYKATSVFCHGDDVVIFSNALIPNGAVPRANLAYILWDPTLDLMSAITN